MILICDLIFHYITVIIVINAALLNLNFWNSSVFVQFLTDF